MAYKKKDNINNNCGIPNGYKKHSNYNWSTFDQNDGSRKANVHHRYHNTTMVNESGAFFKHKNINSSGRGGEGGALKYNQ